MPRSRSASPWRGSASWLLGEAADGAGSNLRHRHIVEDTAERTGGKNIDILRMDRLRCHGLGREAGDDVADRFILHVRDYEFGARLVRYRRLVEPRTYPSAPSSASPADRWNRSSTASSLSTRTA